MTPPKTVVFWKGVNGSSKTRMTDAAERRNGRSVNSMKAFGGEALKRVHQRAICVSGVESGSVLNPTVTP